MRFLVLTLLPILACDEAAPDVGLWECVCEASAAGVSGSATSLECADGDSLQDAIDADVNECAEDLARYGFDGECACTCDKVAESC